jgi:hypothetical protein
MGPAIILAQTNCSLNLGGGGGKMDGGKVNLHNTVACADKPINFKTFTNYKFIQQLTTYFILNIKIILILSTFHSGVD